MTQTNLPELILSSVQTAQGGTTLKLIPKPQEGIDGISVSKSVDQPMVLVSDPITSKGGISVLHLVPKPVPNPWDNSS